MGILSKGARVLGATALLWLMPGCVVVGGDTAEFDRDLRPESVPHIRAIAAESNWIYPIPLPLLDWREGYMPRPASAKPDAPIRSTRIHAFLTNLFYFRFENAFFHPQTGKRIDHSHEEYALLGCYSSWDQLSDESSGWWVFWGMIKHETKAGESDWTFFWFL